VTSEPKKWLAFETSYMAGDDVNYYPDSGRDPFLGSMKRATAGFTLRPGPRLRIQETYLYSGLWTSRKSGLQDLPNGTSVFNNHILRSKVNYHFDRQASLRAIVDYNGVLPNDPLVSLEREKHVGLDLLFTYMVNPGTAVHVGYTDLYDNWRLDPTRSPELQRTQFPDLNTGRQAFVKLSYLFRF
jgi:hypothetical protein